MELAATALTPIQQHEDDFSSGGGGGGGNGNGNCNIIAQLPRTIVAVEVTDTKNGATHYWTLEKLR